MNIFLYRVCVLFHPEFAHPVWSSVKSIHALEVIQHTALRMALGAIDKSSVINVKIISQVLPLDIKLDRNYIQPLIKSTKYIEETRTRKRNGISLLSDLDQGLTVSGHLTCLPTGSSANGTAST